MASSMTILTAYPDHAIQSVNASVTYMAYVTSLPVNSQTLNLGIGLTWFSYSRHANNVFCVVHSIGFIFTKGLSKSGYISFDYGLSSFVFEDLHAEIMEFFAHLYS